MKKNSVSGTCAENMKCHKASNAKKRTSPRVFINDAMSYLESNLHANRAYSHKYFTPSACSTRIINIHSFRCHGIKKGIALFMT